MKSWPPPSQKNPKYNVNFHFDHCCKTSESISSLPQAILAPAHEVSGYAPVDV